MEFKIFSGAYNGVLCTLGEAIKKKASCKTSKTVRYLSHCVVDYSYSQTKQKLHKNERAVIHYIDDQVKTNTSEFKAKKSIKWQFI